ncbi:MAG: ABC-F family ATPase, partial [Polyangiaceae bacterium]|nr:ABC-F family ATPase [Polyangiaceae bacterium]
EAIHALVEALKAYEGTVLFVSHDRWFVSRLATRILEVTPSGPRDFPGTYDEYLERCGDDHLDAEAVVLKAKREKRADAQAAAQSAVGASWEEKKRRRNLQRNLQKTLPVRRDRVLAMIEAAEARKKAIHDLYATPGFFEKTPKADVNALMAEEAALGPQIDTLMAEWEALEAEIASLEAENAIEGDDRAGS